jgi:hypothetical protein
MYKTREVYFQTSQDSVCNKLTLKYIQPDKICKFTNNSVLWNALFWNICDIFYLIW